MNLRRSAIYTIFTLSLMIFISVSVCAREEISPKVYYDFSYDGLSRLTSAKYSDASGGTDHYSTAYDINNRPRSIKFASGTETRYIYDATGVKLRTEHVIPEVPPLLPGRGEIDAVNSDSVGTIGGSGINIGGLPNLFVTNTSNSPSGNNPSINGMPALPDTTTISGGRGSIVDGDFTSRFDYTVVSVTDYCGPFVYENGILDRINLDNGYLSYRSRTGSRLDVPEYHFYLRDHLGNNRMDINAANQRNNQAMHYYPFGLPFYTDSRVTSDSRSGLQRWLFGNKELDRTSGLDLYDFEARAYDPTIIRFRRPDDLAQNYFQTSLYTYCFNNPLKYIDPTGEIPSEMEGAKIADHVYYGKVGERLLGNWEMLKEYTTDDSKSFRGGLYGRKDENGNILEYAFATAGTYMEFSIRCIASICEDLKQPFGASYDMKYSTGLATEISKELGVKELTFVGHSKGAAEAAGNALATGRNALLYNPAAINASAYGLDVSTYKGTDSNGMRVFVVEGDFLNNINKSQVSTKNFGH